MEAADWWWLIPLGPAIIMYVIPMMLIILSDMVMFVLRPIFKGLGYVFGTPWRMKAEREHRAKLELERQAQEEREAREQQRRQRLIANGLSPDWTSELEDEMEARRWARLGRP